MHAAPEGRAIEVHRINLGVGAFYERRAMANCRLAFEVTNRKSISPLPRRLCRFAVAHAFLPKKPRDQGIRELITEQRVAQPQAARRRNPRFAAGVTEDLLFGSRRLRAAFLQTPMRFAGRDMPLLRAGALATGGDPGPQRARLSRLRAARRPPRHPARPADRRFRRAAQYRDGPRDGDTSAANRVGYHMLGAATLRELFADFLHIVFRAGADRRGAVARRPAPR